MLDNLTMPPAGGLDETDEQKRARLLTPNVMPPTGTPAQPQPQPSTNVMPPAGQPQPQPAPPTNVMPPAPAQPSQPPPAPANAMPPAMVAPAQQKPPELHGWKKALDAVGSVFPIGRAVESAIPGTPQNWELNQAKEAERRQSAAKASQEESLATQEQAKAEALLHPPAKPPLAEKDTWKQVPETNWEVNSATGETRQMQGVTLPTKEAKPPEHFPAGEMVADPNAPGGFKQVGDRPAAKPDEKDKEISDYLAANKLEDTPVNRDKARTALVSRNRVGGYGEPGGNLNLGGEEYLKSLDPSERAIVSEIGTGKAAPERIAYILARNPKLTAEMALAFPDLDTSKLGSYVTTYKDFTSGPASIAINAGNTALLHLNELRKLNTYESRIPGTKDYQAYQNKLDTISAELGRFYGNTTLEGIAGYKKTLGSMFNRDAAITTQAQSMGDKLDSFENQWKNAAPSKSYQAPLPGISDAAKQARAELDPNYKAKTGGASGVQPKDFGAANGKPDGATGTMPDGTKVVVKGGRITAAQ